jgi:hypothetical protein
MVGLAMTQRVRTELQALLKRAAEQRKRLKELELNLDQLYRKIGRTRSHTDGGIDPKSGARKNNRKK